jgi:hypothetical protein
MGILKSKTLGKEWGFLFGMCDTQRRKIVTANDAPQTPLVTHLKPLL